MSSSFKDFAGRISLFLRKREQLIEAIQRVANTNNRLTFITSQKIADNTSDAVQSSRMTLELSEELLVATEDMVRATAEMESLMNIATEALHTQNNIAGINAGKDSAWPVDISYLISLIGNLQQQFLLESNIVETLRVSIANTNQDSLVTMVACFEYPPYISFSDLQTLIGHDS